MKATKVELRNTYKAIITTRAKPGDNLRKNRALNIMNYTYECSIMSVILFVCLLSLQESDAEVREDVVGLEVGLSQHKHNWRDL